MIALTKRGLAIAAHLVNIVVALGVLAVAVDAMVRGPVLARALVRWVLPRRFYDWVVLALMLVAWWVVEAILRRRRTP